MTHRLWTRRGLLQTAGLAVGAQSVRALGTVLPRQEAQSSEGQGTHLYAIKPADAQSPAGLRVFTRSPNGWQSRQFIPNAQVRLLLADAAGYRLYAAHRREPRRGEPAGQVESFRIDPSTGRLTSMGRQSLALSAGTPVAMTLSPQRNLLVVAAVGGVFSLLPLHPEGELQPVAAAHKQVPVSTTDGLPTRMHFVGESQLIVQTERSVCAYECNAQGMRLTHKDVALATAFQQVTPSPPNHAASFVLLTL